MISRIIKMYFELMDDEKCKNKSHHIKSCENMLLQLLTDTELIELF